MPPAVIELTGMDFIQGIIFTGLRGTDIDIHGRNTTIGRDFVEPYL